MGVSHSRTKHQPVTVTVKYGEDDVDHTITSSSQKRGNSFRELSDDLMIEILSFIYVPFVPFEEGLENRGGKKASSSDASSSLTYNLPLVSSHFRDLCKLDLFWLPSLQRLVYSDPQVFKEVLKVMLNAEFKRPPWSAFHDSDVDKDSFLLEVKKMDTLNKEDMFELVSNVYKSMMALEEKEEDGNYHNKMSTTNTFTRMHSHSRNQSIEILNEMDNAGEDGKSELSSTRKGLVKSSGRFSSSSSSYIRDINSARSMYLSLIKVYTNPIYPVYRMRLNSLHLGTRKDLVILDVGHKLLISEVMKGRKKKDHRGLPLSAPRPRFIFAHTSQALEPGLSAFVVEVCRCRMLDGGRAHISIEPVERVKLISVSKRQGHYRYFGLHDARIMRLS